MKTSALPAKVCKISAYARCLPPMSRGPDKDLYRATHTVTRDLGFMVSSEGPPPHVVAGIRQARVSEDDPHEKI